MFKIIQINTFDGIKALFLRQNGKGKFNMANYILLNLFFGGLVSGHFFLFNFVFYGKTEPCLGKLSIIKVSTMEFNMVLQMPCSILI